MLRRAFQLSLAWPMTLAQSREPIRTKQTKKWTKLAQKPHHRNDNRPENRQGNGPDNRANNRVKNGKDRGQQGN